MPFAIALSLDPAFQTQVRSLWQKLASGDINSSMIETGYPPHVTMAVWDSPHPDLVAPEIAALAARTAPLRLVAESLGFFRTSEDVLFLSPTVTAELLRLHAEVCGVLTGAGADIRAYYQPGHWIPHCTLAIDLSPERVPAAMSICQEDAGASAGSFDGLAVGRFPPGQLLYTFDFAGRSEQPVP